MPPAQRGLELLQILMAVFTEVSEDEAGELVRALGPGRAARAARHPWRHREHQLLPDHGPGRVRADPVRAPDVRAAAVLPAPDEAPGAARHPGARAPGAARERHRGQPRWPDPAQGLRQARGGGGQAARPSANWRRRRRIARPWAKCWRACTWPRATIRAASPTCAAWPGGTRPCRWCCPTPIQSQAALLRSELAFQNHVAAGSAYAALPRGPIHADLFRDNVMFEEGRLTGFFDFYFAGVDSWLFDIAVCLNDWCVELAIGRPRRPTGPRPSCAPTAACGRWQRRSAQLLPAMLRAGALRFWISRLWDYHLPRDAAMLQAARPEPFRAGAAPAGGAPGALRLNRLHSRPNLALALNLSRKRPSTAEFPVINQRPLRLFLRTVNETQHRSRAHWHPMGQARHPDLLPSSRWHWPGCSSCTWRP